MAIFQKENVVFAIMLYLSTFSLIENLYCTFFLFLYYIGHENKLKQCGQHFVPSRCRYIHRFSWFDLLSDQIMFTCFALYDERNTWDRWDIAVPINKSLTRSWRSVYVPWCSQSIAWVASLSPWCDIITSFSSEPIGSSINLCGLKTMSLKTNFSLSHSRIYALYV